MKYLSETIGIVLILLFITLRELSRRIQHFHDRGYRLREVELKLMEDQSDAKEVGDGMATD